MKSAILSLAARIFQTAAYFRRLAVDDIAKTITTCPRIIFFEFTQV